MNFMLFKKSTKSRLIYFLLLSGIFTTSAIDAQDINSELTYTVSSLHFQWAEEHEDLPNLSLLEKIRFPLQSLGNHFIVSDPEGAIPLHCLKTEKPFEYTPEAIAAIARRVVTFCHEHHLSAVVIAPDPTEIGGSGADLRCNDDNALTFIIYTNSIGSLQTCSVGCNTIDAPCYDHIIKYSPLQSGDLLNYSKLQHYLYYLDRYPGRQTALNLLPTPTPGVVDIQYRIYDEKPLKFYASVANTGSQNNLPWVWRAGMIHQHLTGIDDLLTLDYATTNFQDYHYLRLYYERPIFPCWRLRGFGEASWSEFTAAEFGLLEEEFEGTQKRGALGLITNVWQWCRFFLDLQISADLWQIRVENHLAGTTGETQFILPSASVHLQYKSQTCHLFSALSIETNLPNLAGTDPDEMEKLGRLTRDKRFSIIRGKFFASHYIDNCWAIHKEESQDSFCHDQPPPCLHHELALLASGQYAFKHRLVPQMEVALGGLHTIRGYPQSLVAGGKSLWGQAEYRYHLNPLPCSWRSFGRLFLDAGATYFSNPNSTEKSRELFSAGIGAQAEWHCHFRARLDLGWALRAVPDLSIPAGNAQLFGSMTVIY